LEAARAELAAMDNIIEDGVENQKNSMTPQSVLLWITILLMKWRMELNVAM
jgi:hypothetical protein